MLNINSKTIKDDLMNIHGIMPCKSLNIKFPFVPEEYLHHFVRGYFDGDGHVNSHKYFVSFVGGSYNFMNSFKDILENNKFQLSFVDKEKQYRIYLSGKNNVNKFSQWIYKNKGLHLKRKYNIFQEKNNCNDDRIIHKQVQL